MTLTRKALISAARRARHAERLIGRLAGWSLYPPADPSTRSDIEAEARRELRALTVIFQGSVEEMEKGDEDDG